MTEKIKLDVELDAEDLAMLRGVAEKFDMSISELLMQELREKLIELDTWEHRFALLHKEK